MCSPDFHSTLFSWPGWAMSHWYKMGPWPPLSLLHAMSDSFPLAALAFWRMERSLDWIVIPSFPDHPTFWDLSPSGNPLVSWCGPYRQGWPPLLSLWPESTLLCVSAHSQVWQRLLDVDGNSRCTAVWHLPTVILNHLILPSAFVGIWKEACSRRVCEGPC